MEEGWLRVEVKGRKWDMDETQEVLVMSVDGEEIEFPIGNVCHPDFEDAVDFDIIYVVEEESVTAQAWREKVYELSYWHNSPCDEKWFANVLDVEDLLSPVDAAFEERVVWIRPEFENEMVEMMFKNKKRRW